MCLSPFSEKIPYFLVVCEKNKSAISYCFVRPIKVFQNYIYEGLHTNGFQFNNPCNKYDVFHIITIYLRT